MKQYNYKSDFKFYPNFTNAGNTVSIPSYDFDINLISKYTIYTASRRGNVYSNCKLVDGKLLVICDNHKLSVGIITIEFIAYLPDSDFPDGDKKTVNLATDQIELVLGNGDDLTQVDITLALNYAVIECYDVAVKYGYTGTKEDFYAALIATPTVIPQAQEAITELNNLNTEVSQNEETRKGNETTRINSENTRVNNETGRGNAEATRVSNETVRATNEQTRVSNETDRNSKESTRVSNEATRVANEVARVNKESERQNNENTRKSNEDSRVSAETIRGNNETTRKSNEDARVLAENNRGAAEGGRATAETARVNAETGRVFEFNQIKTDVSDALLHVNNATETAADAANKAYSASDDANGAATVANEKASLANDAATAANAAAQAAQTAAASLNAQTYTGPVYSNPYTVGNITPRRIGDVAINATTLEIWQAIRFMIPRDATSWTRISAGIYGGTLATDLNAINLSGWITILSTGLNVPNSAENWYVNQTNSNSGTLYAYQTAVGFTTGDRYWRTKINSVWGAWTKEEHFTTAYKNQVDINKTDIAELKKWNPRAYGVEFTKGQLDPSPGRWIGDIGYQTNNYIWEKLKLAKIYPNGTIKYLNQTNINFFDDGSPSGVVIDGTTVTDDGGDLLLSNPSPFYAILGGTHATLERRMVCDTQFSYDGDTAVLIPANAVCIDYSVIKNGVQRSIRDNTLVGSGSAGIGGLSYLADGHGSPNSGLSRFQYEAYARAKNADTTKNTPYANSFQFDLNVWFTLLCIKFRTKDLHSASMLGGCISSNDANPTVSTWGTQTGVRVTEVNGSRTYYNIGFTRFCALSTDSAQTFWNILNQYRPLLKMFEMQLALSYAKANSIGENTNFTYDGSTYNYVNVPGHKNIGTGEMTAKVRKLVTMSFTGWDKTNNAAVTNIVIDYCFEQAIVKGKIAGWGNMWEWTSGIDAVCDNTGSLNNQYTFYQISDISKMTTDTDATDKNAGETFAFEKVYDLVGTQPNIGGNVANYIRQMYDNSLIAKTLGSSAGLHTAECSYIYMGSTTSGKRSRRGVYFGGNAIGGTCALRFYIAANSPTGTGASIAGGFRLAL